MPQASEDLRAEWGGPDGSRAVRFLEDAGYVLDRTSCCWNLPRPGHVPTVKEVSAVRFLIDEWDFGGIVRPPRESEGDAETRDQPEDRRAAEDFEAPVNEDAVRSVLSIAAGAAAGLARESAVFLGPYGVRTATVVGPESLTSAVGDLAAAIDLLDAFRLVNAAKMDARHRACLGFFASQEDVVPAAVRDACLVIRGLPDRESLVTAMLEFLPVAARLFGAEGSASEGAALAKFSKMCARVREMSRPRGSTGG